MGSAPPAGAARSLRAVTPSRRSADGRSVCAYRVVGSEPLASPTSAGKPRHRRRQHLRSSSVTRSCLRSSHDRLPPKVPALVVRLKRRVASLREPDWRLPGVDGRPVSVDRRAPIGLALGSLPGCEARAEPLAPPRQVAARDPALHRARLPPHRRGRGGSPRAVRDSLHGPTTHEAGDSDHCLDSGRVHARRLPAPGGPGRPRCERWRRVRARATAAA